MWRILFLPISFLRPPDGLSFSCLCVKFILRLCDKFSFRVCASGLAFASLWRHLIFTSAWQAWFSRLCDEFSLLRPCDNFSFFANVWQPWFSHLCYKFNLLVSLTSLVFASCDKFSFRVCVTRFFTCMWSFHYFLIFSLSLRRVMRTFTKQ